MELRVSDFHGSTGIPVGMRIRMLLRISGNGTGMGSSVVGVAIAFSRWQSHCSPRASEGMFLHLVLPFISSLQVIVDI